MVNGLEQVVGRGQRAISHMMLGHLMMSHLWLDHPAVIHQLCRSSITWTGLYQPVPPFR